MYWVFHLFMVGTPEDTQIPHAFNSVFYLTVFDCHQQVLASHLELILYYLHSMPLAAFSSLHI